MAAGYKMALSCQDGRHVDPAKVQDTNCHHIANSIPNNGWTPKYYTKLAFMLKRNVRCDIVLVSDRCGSTIHQLPSRTTFEAILTPHVHSRAEHISSSHIYRRHQSSGNCGIIWYLIETVILWRRRKTRFLLYVSKVSLISPELNAVPPVPVGLRRRPHMVFCCRNSKFHMNKMLLFFNFTYPCQISGI